MPPTGMWGYLAILHMASITNSRPALEIQTLVSGAQIEDLVGLTAGHKLYVGPNLVIQLI